jgi:hypothetical protein
MWTRFKRMWSKGQGERASDHDGPELDPGRRHDLEVEEAPPAIVDPLVADLEDYDAASDSASGRGLTKSQRLRALMLEHPSDPRVLRRAAALTERMAEDDGARELAQTFERAARTTREEPLLELAEVFFGMEDFGLALAFADGACQRAKGGGRDGAGLLMGALVLARTGMHADVLRRLAPLVERPEETASGRRREARDTGQNGDYDDASVRLGARVRYALSALLLGEGTRLGELAGTLGEAEGWLDEVAARADAFPAEGAEEDARQRLLFLLYGAVLLDDADAERLGAARIARWIHAVAAVVRATMPMQTRPVWVSPRGEVLARWLGSLLPENAAMPLSARLPKQPVLVVLADDRDLAALYEQAPNEALPLFQALKDPAEVGSAVADLIGVFRAGVTLPFEPLEAERAADRVTPRMLALRLAEEAGRVPDEELAGFLGWFSARRELVSLDNPHPIATRVVLDPARL